jgi:ATP-dependent exoDNAse (exonuclease V) alpha subunit
MVQDPSRSYETLSREQQSAADQVESFLRSPRQIFSVAGPAGSGKTRLLAHVAHGHPGAIVTAPTGKAASVLRARSGLPATTIHNALFRLREKRKEGDRLELEFDLARGFRDGGLSGKLILVDESSMCTRWLGNQVVKTGAKIISFGDDFQLPPVGDTAFFGRADVVLREVHRQALDSAVIRQATQTRAGMPYQPDGDDFRRVRQLTDDQLAEADAILCWRNDTRNYYNRRLRRRQGLFPNTPPKAGEPTLCLQNAARHGIYNGEIHPLAEDYVAGSEEVAVLVNGEVVRIDPARFCIGVQCDHDDYFMSSFDFGYALTVHKAQGSEWDHVVLVDEFPESYPDRARWLYTGITRASKRVTVIRP